MHLLMELELQCLRILSTDENGQLKSNTFVDYLVPSAIDIPHLITSSIETDSLFAPKGIRGVGEGGGTR